jgi:LmbE family N-acetylglucosaminyl deacetylase
VLLLVLGVAAPGRSDQAPPREAAKKLRVVIVGAHPDDPESGCGGLIAKLSHAGHKVIVGYVTCFRGDRKIGAEPEAVVRRQEATAACKLLGATPHFFDYAHEKLFADEATLATVGAWLQEMQPDIVVTHWPLDTHPNHHVTSSLVWQAYLQQDHWSLYFFEVMTDQQTQNFRPELYLDIEGFRDLKRRALACHRSQKPEAIWEVHEAMHRRRGAEAGVQYAEAYVRAAGMKQRPELPMPFRGPVRRRTKVTIQGDAFLMNGRPTYLGRTWEGKKVEGLLFNARLVQGIFDDLNPATRPRWAYPDSGRWDPERNTREFLAAVPAWRRHGLLAFTLNLQGGSPQGYSKEQPWHNSALTETGALRPDYLKRLERILDKADELGMAVILGLFYFGQDERLRDEAAVVRGLDNTVAWVLERGYRNVLIEVNNECNVRYHHAILQPRRVHELIERVKRQPRDGRRLLVSTSYGGGTIPEENVVRAADFLLLHGNGVKEPDQIAAMVRRTRQVPGYRPMPILFNEDDHYDFDRPNNNFVVALGEYASWGYFDYRRTGEGLDDGFQSVPVNWQIASARKRAFFRLVEEITGSGK